MEKAQNFMRTFLLVISLKNLAICLCAICFVALEIAKMYWIFPYLFIALFSWVPRFLTLFKRFKFEIFNDILWRSYWKYFSRKLYTIITLSFFNLVNLAIYCHCTKKWSFPLRVSSVNVTRFAGICGFGHIYWRNH